MPGKIKFGITGGVEADSGPQAYTGPVPPKGPYTGLVKRIELTETGPNSKTPGTPMLRILVELKAQKGSKNAKYDGYGIWNYRQITDQGKGYVNQFLDALTDGTPAACRKIRKGFWDVGVVTEEDDGGHVIKIGTIKIDSPKCSIPVAFVGRTGKDQNDEPNLEIASWLLAKGKTDDEDLGDDEDEDEEDEDLDEDEDEDDEDEDDSDDEDEDEDEDEEDEPEPEPVKKPKKAKAKKGKDLF